MYLTLILALLLGLVTRGLNIVLALDRDEQDIKVLYTAPLVVVLSKERLDLSEVLKAPKKVIISIKLEDIPLEYC